MTSRNRKTRVQTYPEKVSVLDKKIRISDCLGEFNATSGPSSENPMVFVQDGAVQQPARDSCTVPNRIYLLCKTTSDFCLHPGPSHYKYIIFRICPVMKHGDPHLTFLGHFGRFTINQTIPYVYIYIIYLYMYIYILRGYV